MPTDTRDAIARRLGNTRKVWESSGCAQWYDKDGKPLGNHPVPASVDALIALWREHLPGWEWRRHTIAGGGMEWTGTKYGAYSVVVARVRVPDTGNLLDDAALLLLKCLEAEK